MAVNNYDITAAAYQPGKARDYELSILTGMDSFAYVIRDRKDNVLLAYRSYTLESGGNEADWERGVEQLIRADDKLRSVRYGSCVLGWESRQHTLVPAALYDSAAPRLYLEQLTTVGLEDAVRTTYYQELGGYLVWSAPAGRLESVERRLAPLRTHHVVGGLLVAWAARSRRLNHQSVSCAVRGGKLVLAAHERGKLLFFNTFPYASDQDALYYLLLAYEQCGWRPAVVPLYLCGEITRHGKLRHDFARYVEDIRYSNYPTPPATPPELISLPEHVYFELLCLG